MKTPTLSKNQKIALIVVFALIDAWGIYDSRRRTYTKLWHNAVEAD
jgi:hypothetical protein